jgi:hypothetical protein
MAGDAWRWWQQVAIAIALAITLGILLAILAIELAMLGLLLWG